MRRTIMVMAASLPLWSGDASAELWGTVLYPPVYRGWIRSPERVVRQDFVPAVGTQYAPADGGYRYRPPDPRVIQRVQDQTAYDRPPEKRAVPIKPIPPVPSLTTTSPGSTTIDAKTPVTPPARPATPSR